jgi:8-oxo-dGTP pyrophosphatase MutT (NUDIX family)
MADRLGPDAVGAGFDVPMYALGAVVYAERGDEILLLKRAAGSALAGQWFLPGGAIERGELPEDGARRELREEAGLEIEGELELVGAYPMHVYGVDMIQLSYRGPVAASGDVVVSAEHDGAQWVRATDMQALLTADFIERLANGDDRVRSLLLHIARDLERYIDRVG